MRNPAERKAGDALAGTAVPSVADELTPAQHARLCTAALLLISVLDQAEPKPADRKETLAPDSNSVDKRRPARRRKKAKRLSRRRRSGQSTLPQVK